MKNIDITTPQNVTVRYTLATVWERGFALAFDIMIMSVGWLVIWILQAIFIPSGSDMIYYFTLLPFIVFYSLAFEFLNHGQSPGKRVLKLRVIRMDGEKTNFFDYLMRWIFRSLEIYSSFGGIAILSIISSNKNQRIGDLLANTVVVNVAKNERMQIENLLKLNKMAQHKLTYPQVAKMPEDAMLLIKETLAKKREIDNDAHNEAFELLVQKMKNELNVKVPKDKELFLRTILKDYIILTR